MPILGKLAIAAALEFCALGVAAQDLAPRAYVITPLHSNAVTLTYSYYTGGLQFDGAVPITGATAQISAPVLTYYYSLSFFGHLSYDFKPRLWVSLDGNFWYGGETSLNGVPNPRTVERNSRIGATAAIPISKHQSVKISYNNGAYINYGGNYQNISLAWQYSWVGWPK
jgi:hypothetical protein